MEYPFVTVTDAGADLLASTNGDPNNSLVIDKAVFSNQKSNTNKPLEQLTPSDFANPLVYQITTVKHHQNTIQPEVTLDNKNFQQNYPIYMIGILAHAENDNSGNETLYAVEEASNDPMIMPKATDNDFNCTFGIPIGISRSQDVNIVTTEAGTVSDKDFKDYKDSMDSQLASSAANQVADSSSLTNLSQSASYNSSNITNLNDSYASISSSVNANSSNISTINGKLSNAADNTSVSTAISNISSTADINSNNINTLSNSVNNNGSNISSLMNTVSNLGNNNSSNNFNYYNQNAYGGNATIDIEDLDYEIPGDFDQDEAPWDSLSDGIYINSSTVIFDRLPPYHSDEYKKVIDHPSNSDDLILFIFRHGSEAILIDTTLSTIYICSSTTDWSEVATSKLIQSLNNNLKYINNKNIDMDNISCGDYTGTSESLNNGPKGLPGYDYIHIRVLPGEANDKNTLIKIQYQSIVDYGSGKTYLRIYTSISPKEPQWNQLH